MWLGDITVGSDSAVDSAAPAAPASPWVNLAANVVDMIHPYKQGVPVNVAIAPQTQTFLMVGGVLIAGLVILSWVKR
jgi:hypothetical protein